MRAASFIQFFHCLSPLHNGSGQGLGSIDRPIVREVTTKYPYVQSSTIKGVYAARARATATATDAWTDWAFGVSETKGNQGCVLFGDASVLAFPVRSLVGSFAWTTSPLALARYARLAGFVDDKARLERLRTQITGLLDNLGHFDEGTAIVAGSAEAVAYQRHCYLESLVLPMMRDTAAPAHHERLAGVAAALAELVFTDDDVFWKRFFSDRLVLLHNQDFEFLIEHATTVEANIRINEETGVTDDGSLRYTEFLPAETILSSLVVIEQPLDKDARRAGDVSTNIVVDKLKELVEKEAGTVQLGADETKGKGLTRTRLHRELK